MLDRSHRFRSAVVALTLAMMSGADVGVSVAQATPDPGGEEPKSLAQASVFYALFYGGAGLPTGNISEMGDDLQFPEVPASDVYKTSPQFGIALGVRGDGLVVELSFEGGLLWLTDSGKELSRDWRNQGEELRSEFGSLEVTVAKAFALGSSVAPFAGGAVGMLVHSVGPVDSGESDGDFGFGVALKAGVDWAPAHGIFIRLGARYQAVTVSVGVPKMLTAYLGAAFALPL